MVFQEGIVEYIDALLQSPRFGGCIRHHTVIEEREAAFSNPDRPWPAEMDETLKRLGIQKLYHHQTEAINRIRSNIHTVAATPTASGKTLVYNLPVLEKILLNPQTTALYIFPLKALAQDQLRAFQTLAAHCPTSGPSAAIYDGDTSAYFRKKIRSHPPNVLMTNPEMIHLSLLPFHTKWAHFFESLAVVVIDEVHTYRGVMGSHMAQVFRRLRRVCDTYHSHPTFCFTSATVGNPSQLAGQLTGLTVETVDRSTARQGRRHVVFMDDPAQSPARTAILLLKAALGRRLRTIVYTQSRKMAELIAVWAKQRSGRFAPRISAYRAGFLPEERRLIEQRLMAGDLLAVISTSALELGIDIGDLDLCILVGYPGSIVSTWQRGGRVGRSGQASALIMIAGQDALDQYFMNNPRDFFTRKPEAAVINPVNAEVLKKQLVCAAAEMPLQSSERWLQAPQVEKVVRGLEADGELMRNADGSILFARRRYPHRGVDLRGAGHRIKIVCSVADEVIGEIDAVRAMRETHPGAIYLHMGKTYVVREYAPETGSIRVAPAPVNYYTRVRAQSDTQILDIDAERALYGVTCFKGRLRVTDQVTGYDRIAVRDGRRLENVPLDLPPVVFETQGMWFDIPDNIVSVLDPRRFDFLGGIHAAEHALIGIFPLLVMADRNDLGGLSTPIHPQVGAAAIFIYDGVAGGAGLCFQAFERSEALIDTAVKAIDACSCESGCPSCVQSPKCGSGNRPIDKAAALMILNEIRCRPAAVPETATVRSSKSHCPSLEQQKPEPALRFGVLDIETQLSAQEVGGWHHAHQMKVSCAVLYDSKSDRYYEYVEGQIPSLISRMEKMDLIVGFNIKRFDYRVLSGYIDYPFSRLNTLDILESVKASLGFRLSLDHLAGATLGKGKNGDGLLALKWWKEGKLGQVIEYCRGDVAITRDLYLFGKKNRYLLYHDRQGWRLRVPVGW